jgi:mycothiol synthase
VDTGTLTWRQLTIEGAPALTRSWAAIEAVDRTGEHYSEQDLRDVLEDESIDLGRDTLVAVAPDGEAVAFAWVHGSAAVVDVDRVWVDGGVVPAARRRGLGRRLLGWAEARATSLHRQRHPGVPGAARVVVHESNAGKEALVRATGYEPARWNHTMVRSLDDPLPDLPATRSGLTVTPYTADRDEAVRLAHVEAFADDWGATPPDEQEWSRWYTPAATFQPEVSWLVMDAEQVVGYLLTHFWKADAAATGVREAYVGQLGVRPAWRRRGLGGLLLATALHSYRAGGYRRSALGVDTANPSGALGLYERAGFAVRDTWVTWLKPLG